MERHRKFAYTLRIMFTGWFRTFRIEKDLKKIMDDCSYNGRVVKHLQVMGTEP
jgi:hypothetical protein